MEKELSFEAMLDQVVTLGEEERETIELARKISAIIEVLVNARITMGLTQRQLAEKSGIKQSAIARIERVQVIPRLDTIIKIAQCLGCMVSIENSVPETKTVDTGIVYLGEYRIKKENLWNQQQCAYSF